MFVRFVILLIATNILFNGFTIGTRVSDEDDNADQFTTSNTSSLFGFGKAAKHLALNLYYGENQQIRGKQNTCGWIAKIVCYCFGCCNNDSKNIDTIPPDYIPEKESNTDQTAELYVPEQTLIQPEYDDKATDTTSEGIIKDLEIHDMESADFEKVSTNESPLVGQSTTLSNIASIKTWIEEEAQKFEYFPSTMEDHMIERFLVVCKNDIKKAQAFIQRFFEYRENNPEFFTNRDPEADNLQKVMEIVHIVPLRKRTKDGFQVNITRIPDSKSFKFLDYAKAYFNLADVRMLTEEEIPKGDEPIYDVGGVVLWKHPPQLSTSYNLIQQFSTITEQAQPMDVQRIHVINMTPFLKVTLDTVLKFMSEKTRKKVVTHAKGSDTIFEYIPKEIMPPELGGTGTSLAEEREHWKNELVKYRQWLLDNSWRSGSPKEL